MVLPFEPPVIQRVDEEAASLPLARTPQVFVQAARPVQRTSAVGLSPLFMHANPSESSIGFGDSPAASTAMPSVQRVASQEWVVQAENEPLPATSRVAAPVHASATGEQASAEETAAKLYDRIRTKLRNELLVDRERAGMLTDLR